MFNIYQKQEGVSQKGPAKETVKSRIREARMGRASGREPISGERTVHSLGAQGDHSHCAGGTLGSHTLVSLNMPSPLHSSDIRLPMELCDPDCIFHIVLYFASHMYLSNLFLLCFFPFPTRDLIMTWRASRE